VHTIDFPIIAPSASHNVFLTIEFKMAAISVKRSIAITSSYMRVYGKHGWRCHAVVRVLVLASRHWPGFDSRTRRRKTVDAISTRRLLSGMASTVLNKGNLPRRHM
jgi:hypothetical protein